MKGKDFINSKWCKRGGTAQGQAEVEEKFGNWAARVNNTGILGRAKQLYQFFVSPNTPRMCKVIVAGALLYIISPVDVVPDMIPVLGWLDDIGVAGFALNYIFSKMDEMSALEEAHNAGALGGRKLSDEELLDAEISGIDSTKNFD